MSSKLFGGGDKQLREMRRAQREQEAQLAEERRKVEAVEAGQRRVRTGGRGLLAFIEDSLGSTFGGA
ncbi:MAG: hypothetical protein WCZ28_06285 [Burkholderiaceae bacterium]